MKKEKNSMLVNSVFFNKLIYNNKCYSYIGMSPFEIKSFGFWSISKSIVFEITFKNNMLILINSYFSEDVINDINIKSSELKSILHYIHLDGKTLLKSKIPLHLSFVQKINKNKIYKVLYAPLSKTAPDKFVYHVLNKL